eukprot:TRINITY_DN11270_c0_g1_i8.p1 TRINITY_DN11270_c0_g1~~TRINITY_DN11270_c0_g1_i8.p1  ORF type:complete len:307 (+),score=34.54 TRINITY_DN11270_c0_g1_i8:270-1190(+)
MLESFYKRVRRSPSSRPSETPSATLNLAAADLSAYFAGPYLDGELLRSEHYCYDIFAEHAFDLRSRASNTKKGDAIVLYHFTDELGFKNVANLQQETSNIFASLLESRAHFGQGVYATQHEPAVWRTRKQVLLNNYANGDPFNPENEDACRVSKEWSHRASFCLPLIVPVALAYMIHVKQTPDMQKKRVKQEGGGERSIALGEDCKGREVHGNRDVWVIRVEDESGAVIDASCSVATFVSLLKKRLVKLRRRRGDTDPMTLQCISGLAAWVMSRSDFEEAEPLLREALHGYRMKLGDMHPNTLKTR